MTAVEFLEKELYERFHLSYLVLFNELIQQAKEMEKKQKGYSEEQVRLAYQKGEEDSYLKGGQTKEMENEFIQSLKQKHELNKSE
jgi:hypothetical protein